MTLTLLLLALLLALLAFTHLLLVSESSSDQPVDLKETQSDISRHSIFAERPAVRSLYRQGCWLHLQHTPKLVQPSARHHPAQLGLVQPPRCQSFLRLHRMSP